jgi:ribosomal protein S8
MASLAAEAFRAKQQSNMDASFNAKINSTTNSYNSQIASYENDLSNMNDNLTNLNTTVDVTNNFLNSDEGKKLVIDWGDHFQKGYSIPSPEKYIKPNNFFGPFDPLKNNNSNTFPNYNYTIDPNQRAFDDFTKEYIDYVNKSNIPDTQKRQLLSHDNLCTAADLYRSSINETVNLKKLTDYWDGNGRMHERVMPTESDAVAAIKKIVENKKLVIASKKIALENKIKNLKESKNAEVAMLSAQYTNVSRMLNDENYINQYEALVLNNSKYAIQMYSDSNKNPEIFDLRNICNKNFRGFDDNTAKINREINSNEFFLKGTNRQMPVSRTYMMNRDYLITDTLALNSHNDFKNPVINEIIGGLHENLKNKMEIQSLILNEFQPYDMITPGDLIPGVLDELAKLGNKAVGESIGIGVSIGRNFLMNSEINRIANNPSLLYGKSEDGNENELKNVRDRRYFSSDPVQVVQNMFNGRKMVKYIPNSILW